MSTLVTRPTPSSSNPTSRSSGLKNRSCRKPTPRRGFCSELPFFLPNTADPPRLPRDHPDHQQSRALSDAHLRRTRPNRPLEFFHPRFYALLSFSVCAPTCWLPPLSFWLRCLNSSTPRRLTPWPRV